MASYKLSFSKIRRIWQNDDRSKRRKNRSRRTRFKFDSNAAFRSSESVHVFYILIKYTSCDQVSPLAFWENRSTSWWMIASCIHTRKRKKPYARVCASASKKELSPYRFKKSLSVITSEADDQSLLPSRIGHSMSCIYSTDVTDKWMGYGIMDHL